MFLYLAVLLFVAAGLTIPMVGPTWALFTIVGAYLGIDQLAAYDKSKTLVQGKKYDLNKPANRRVVLAMAGITGFALLVQTRMISSFLELFLAGFSESEVAELSVPLDQLFTAFGVVGGIYAGGNKANNIAEQKGPKPQPEPSPGAESQEAAKPAEDGKLPAAPTTP
jgi:hypothetical protein